MLDAGFLLVIESLWVGWCIVCLLCMKSVGGWVLLYSWLIYNMHIILICSYWLVLYPEIVISKYGFLEQINWSIDWLIDIFPYAQNQHETGSNQICLLSISHWFLSWLILQPWRWRHYDPPKCQLTFTRLHCVIT
jgi:hypothetical protein